MTTPPTMEETARELLAVEAAMPFMGVALEPDDIRGLVRAVLSALGPPPTEVREGVAEARLNAAAQALYKAYEETTDQHVADIWRWATEHVDKDAREGCASIVAEMREWAAKVLAAADATPPMRDREAIARLRDRVANLSIGMEEIRDASWRGDDAIDRIRNCARRWLSGSEEDLDALMRASLSPPCDCLGVREALAPFAAQTLVCALGIAKATEAGVRCDHCDDPRMPCFKIGRARTALQGPGGEE